MKLLTHWFSDANTHQQKHYAELELIAESPNQRPHEWITLFAQLGQRLIKFLTTEPEPRVHQVVDRAGKVWWRVDVPHSGQSIWFDTESELLSWFERYPFV